MKFSVFVIHPRHRWAVFLVHQNSLDEAVNVANYINHLYGAPAWIADYANPAHLPIGELGIGHTEAAR